MLPRLSDLHDKGRRKLNGRRKHNLIPRDNFSQAAALTVVSLQQAGVIFPAPVIMPTRVSKERWKLEQPHPHAITNSSLNRTRKMLSRSLRRWLQLSIQFGDDQANRPIRSLPTGSITAIPSANLASISAQVRSKLLSLSSGSVRWNRNCCPVMPPRFCVHECACNRPNGSSPGMAR